MLRGTPQDDGVPLLLWQQLTPNMDTLVGVFHCIDVLQMICIFCYQGTKTGIFGKIMSLGSLLQKSRNAQGLTRQQLADLVDAKVPSIAKYERAGEPHGQFPPMPVLAKLSRVLKISPNVLFAEVSEDQADKDYFLEGTLQAYLKIAETMHWFEQVSAEIDTFVETAERNIKSVLPDNISPEFFEKAIAKRYEKDDARSHVIRDFFYEGQPFDIENGPDQEDPSRSKKTLNNQEAVGAASTSQSNRRDK